MGLHLQPGRRLRASVEKYARDEMQSDPPDVVMMSLLDLLQNRGQANSLEELGEAIKALNDGEEAMVKINTENLLATFVQRLAWSQDFKLAAMAHRYELKLEIVTHLRGTCPHTKRTVTRTRAISLNIGGAQGGLLPFADLQGDLDDYESSEMEEQCSKCGEPLVRTVKHGLKDNCAPDFLTVSCDPPVSLLAPKNLTLKFNGTCYSLGALVQWSRRPRSASVARRMEDGWWWHGVDDGQGSDYKYSAEELSKSAHLANAAVLLLTRVSPKDETLCSETRESQEQSGDESGCLPGRRKSVESDSDSELVTEELFGGKDGNGSDARNRERERSGDESRTELPDPLSDPKAGNQTNKQTNKQWQPLKSTLLSRWRNRQQR